MEKKRLFVCLISRQKSFFIALFIVPPSFSPTFFSPFDRFHALRRFVALHRLHRAVLDVDDAVGHWCNGAVVRDDHDRHALLPAGILQ